MYKVKFFKYALLENDEIGNVKQRTDIVYMECTIDCIEKKIKAYLAKGEKKYYPVINSIEKISAYIIS